MPYTCCQKQNMHPVLQFLKAGHQQSKNSILQWQKWIQQGKDSVRIGTINKIDLTLTKSCFLQGRKSLFRNVLISLPPYNSSSMAYCQTLPTFGKRVNRPTKSNIQQPAPWETAFRQPVCLSRGKIHNKCFEGHWTLRHHPPTKNKTELSVVKTDPISYTRVKITDPL